MLNSKQRAFLKKEAHKLEAIIRIGKDGLTDNLAENLNNAIHSRELVKVKVLQNLEADKNEVREIAEKLAEKIEGEIVEIIGRIIILYKENTEKSVVSNLIKNIK